MSTFKPFFLAFYYSFRHTKNSSATVSLTFDPKIKIGAVRPQALYRPFWTNQALKISFQSLLSL